RAGWDRPGGRRRAGRARAHPRGTGRGRLMRVEDWRHLPSALVAPLYEAETLRWRLSLDWDLRPTVEQLERARAAGTLPGFVLRGPGQSIVGWTYYVVQDGSVQIGSLLARSSDGLRQLL